MTEKEAKIAAFTAADIKQQEVDTKYERQCHVICYNAVHHSWELIKSIPSLLLYTPLLKSYRLMRWLLISPSRALANAQKEYQRQCDMIRYLEGKMALCKINVKEAHLKGDLHMARQYTIDYSNTSEHRDFAISIMAETMGKMKNMFTYQMQRSAVKTLRRTDQCQRDMQLDSSRAEELADRLEEIREDTDENVQEIGAALAQGIEFSPLSGSDRDPNNRGGKNIDDLMFDLVSSEDEQALVSIKIEDEDHLSLKRKLAEAPSLPRHPPSSSPFPSLPLPPSDEFMKRFDLVV